MTENVKDTRAFLLHTIGVNLSILKSELEELADIQAQQSSQASLAAGELLRVADEIATSADQRLNTASTDELGEILSEVFNAMSKTTEARCLLGACKSSS